MGVLTGKEWAPGNWKGGIWVLNQIGLNPVESSLTEEAARPALPEEASPAFPEVGGLPSVVLNLARQG